MCSFSYLTKDLWKRTNEHTYRLCSIYTASPTGFGSMMILEMYRTYYPDDNEYSVFTPPYGLFFIPDNPKGIGLCWSGMKSLMKELWSFVEKHQLLCEIDPRTRENPSITEVLFPPSTYFDSKEATTIVSLNIKLSVLTWEYLDELEEIASKFHYYIF